MLRVCPRWSNLVIRIIEPAIEEINEVSDLTVSYEQEKRGRRVVGVIFFIDLKKPGDEDVIQVESSSDQLLKSLLAYGINKKTAEEYTENINRQDKVNQILAKLPAIAERAKKERPTNTKIYPWRNK